MLLALVLTGCWRPAPWTPPSPPPEAVEGLRADDDDAPDEAPDAIEPDAGEEGDAPEPEIPTVELLARPWQGRLLQAPATLVDDLGNTLVVIAEERAPVEVRAEQPHRLRVWCATCKPPVEGWIQTQLVGPVE